MASSIAAVRMIAAEACVSVTGRGGSYFKFNVPGTRRTLAMSAVRHPSALNTVEGLRKALEFARVPLPLLRARNKFAQDPVDVEAATAVDDVRRLGQSGVSGTELS